MDGDGFYGIVVVEKLWMGLVIIWAYVYGIMVCVWFMLPEATLGNVIGLVVYGCKADVNGLYFVVHVEDGVECVLA